MSDAKHRVFILALSAQWVVAWFSLSDSDGAANLFLRQALGGMVYNDITWFILAVPFFVVTASVSHLIQRAIFSGSIE